MVRLLPDMAGINLETSDTVDSSGLNQERSDGRNKEEESDRLLRVDVWERASVAEVEMEIPGSSSFRQRNNHSNSPFAVDRNVDFKTFPFDVDIAGSSGLVHSESRAKLEADGNLSGTISAADIVRTLIFILLWYTFSTCLTLYNKELLGDKLGMFPAPLLMNTVHFTVQAVLSKIVLWFQNRKRDIAVIMTWKDYFLRVVPTALATALDVNLSNASLVFISVTFATMCKSASPVFLLIFAFGFKLESPSIKLFGIIIIISIGILLTVARETEFEFWGFIFVMLAAVMSGFRWCMTQVLLQV